MNNNFDLYAQYYDLLYKSKDYTAEIDYVKQKLLTYIPEASSILEFGSGTGKHGKILEKNGYQVFGIDKSQKMIEIAQKNGLNCQFGNISNFQLESKFDVVISLFHVISYLIDNKELIATFKNANKHLKKDGVFLFDVWYTPAVYCQKAKTKVKRIANENLKITRIAEPESSVNECLVLK